MAQKPKRVAGSGNKERSSPPSVTPQKSLLACITVLIAAITIGWLIRNDSLSLRRNGGGGPSSYAASVAPRLVFPRDMSYRAIAESRRPLILTKTLIDKWKARRTFTTTFLAKRLEQVSVYHQPKQRHFITFHDQKPLEPLLLDESWDDFNVKINISISQLLQWDDTNNNVLTAKEGPWHYYSQDVNQIRSVFPDIIHYIQPINDLILSEDNVQVNLWIGRAGIITHTHYDATYNFFVQLQGRKRFTLFPPNQTLYLYPCLHPHYGHSQVDILAPNLNQFPLFEGSEAVVAEVGPGDMLVVPPYWFHHVETLEESVSINVWSDAPEYALMNKIYAQPIPFEEEWSWSELVIATSIYTTMIIESVGISDIKQFVSNLVRQRYLPLVKRRNIAFDTNHYEELNEIFKRTDWSSKRQQYKPLFQKESHRISLLLGELPSKSTIKICVGNYLEHLIHRTVGLEHVCPFLAVASGLSPSDFTPLTLEF